MEDENKPYKMQVCTSRFVLSSSTKDCPTVSVMGTDRVTRLNSLGIANLRASRPDEAVQCFFRGLSQLEGLEPESLTQNSFRTERTSQIDFTPEQRLSSIATIATATSINNDICARHEEIYDEGMHFFATLMQIQVAPTDVDAHDEMASVLLYNIGQVHLQQKRDDDAFESFFQALVLTQRRPNKGVQPLVMSILHNIGYIQYRNGEIKKSIRTFTEAIESCDEHTDRVNFAATLNCLGNLYFHLPRADSEKALCFFLRALPIAKEILGAEHPTVATTLNNMGRVHSLEGHFEEGLVCYDEALRIRRKVLGNDHLDVAATIHNAGQTFHQKGDLKKALCHYEEFMRIAIPKLGHSHQDVAMMLKCMAQIHHQNQDYDQALTLYSEALCAVRSSLGMYAEIASILNKMGNLYYEKGEFEAAIGMYRQGLQVERVVLDRNHPNITVTLSNIGQIYKQRGDFDSALRLYEEAYSIQSNSLDVHDPRVAVTLSNMGLIHYQNKNYSAALEMYQEALRIRRDAFSDDNLEVASSLNSVGLVLFKLGLHALALQSFTESLRVRRILLGEAHLDVAVILYNISTIYLELGNEDEAMKCYQETLRVEKVTLGPNHLDVIQTQQYIAQLHQQRGELDQALKSYEEVLKIQRINLPADDASLARTLHMIGNLHLQMGCVSGMVEVMSQAARIVIRSGSNQEDELCLCGFHLYGFAKLHPECAASA